jgi:tetratricopeptide (TPR) repeat protein
MVLAEIDKLKTARVDPDLRFKGRQISRALFELSERGDLHKGVELPNGATVRVVGLSDDKDMPAGLTGRNTDDRILAVALQLRAGAEEEVTLVTNDLNMLLKAQSFGLAISRVETDDSFARRFIVRPFQRYRTPLLILAIALALFAAALYAITLYAPSRLGGGNAGIAGIPSEFLDQISVDQQQVLGYLYRLQSNPKDVEAQSSLAILYDQMSSTNPAYIPLAIKHWEAFLQVTPADADARTDLATLYFREGKVDIAIQQVTQVLRENPDHVNANFNLGIFYLSLKPVEYQKAANQFSKVIKLTTGKATLADILTRANSMLAQVKKSAAAAGTPITTDGGGTL